MIRISALALIAAAAIGVTAPAFARSSQHRVATNKTHSHAVAARQSGLNAFGMVQGDVGGRVFKPALTGGGSAGYNENVLRDE
jgi:hypothetical protein